MAKVYRKKKTGLTHMVRVVGMFYCSRSVILPPPPAGLDIHVFLPLFFQVVNTLLNGKENYPKIIQYVVEITNGFSLSNEICCCIWFEMKCGRRLINYCLKSNMSRHLVKLQKDRHVN